MSKRKPFALRINEDILSAMQKWADDELRSVNGQIEYVLREALKTGLQAAPQQSTTRKSIPRVPPRERVGRDTRLLPPPNAQAFLNPRIFPGLSFTVLAFRHSFVTRTGLIDIYFCQ